MSTILDPTELRTRVAEHLKKEPGTMTPIMARQFQVPESEILRAFPSNLVTTLQIGGDRTLDLIRAFERLGRVHVIATNDACVLETYGYFGGFSLTGPYFNVQTKTLDMHIQYRQLGHAFALIKPSHQDGQTTYSIQFFTEAGRSAFKVFLYKSVSEKEGDEATASIAEWEKIRAEFGAPAT